MKKVTLSEVCEINPPKSIDIPDNSFVSFLPMDSIGTDGHVSYDKTIAVNKIKNYSVFQDNDVLFAKITPCMENGKGAIVSGLLNGYGAGSTEYIVLRPKQQQVSSKWIYLFLAQKQFRMECQQHMTGSAGQKRVPPKYLASCEIPLPPADEQERIVARIEELLSQLDTGVETLKRINQQLIRYRRAAVKYELGREYSDCVWNDTVFGSVCDCLDSKRKPVNKETRQKAEGKYPYYGANGETGRIDDYLFDEELVLICEDETFTGRIKPFSYIISGKSWVNNHAHILRGKTGVLHNRYLNYVLSYYPFLPIVTGTTGRKKLTQEALLKAPVRICDYQTQEKVVDAIDARLSVCDSIEQTVNTALQQAEAMRQSILKQAFEGRL